VLFISIHTLLINLYCAYYVMDDESYAWRRESRNEVSTYIGQEGLGGMLRGFDITGLSSIYSGDQ